MEKDVLLKTHLPGVKLFKKGKVRDIYDLDDKLLIIATDRISAFDVVLPNGIPNKGRILTRLSEFWFDFTKEVIGNHIITADAGSFPEKLHKYAPILEGRSMLVRKVDTVLVECVVRGYLAGSGWMEYQEKSSICGIKLPPGLRESEKLPEPIFTPATKADSGHDINISEEKMAEMVGPELAQELKTKSLEIYTVASGYAESKGLIISDTKFEFGKCNDEIIIIDELLTPDSSRFWPVEDYEPGRPQKSFDKQFVRDYLETLDWNKTPPAPQLPDETIKKTSEKYTEAYRKLTGREKL
ncbi:phosphoribosylaminoimidazolesuccinocarboxamide synthase [bacterium]|nr:phosphoribosylaminoimidazolesuccinocarboxamide synthase [bacterium]MCK4326582.1 phosphoribosylaminoimidazolesuccinocarboxamide synthase [bacterium]